MGLWRMRIMEFGQEVKKASAKRAGLWESFRCVGGVSGVYAQVIRLEVLV